LQEFTGEIQQIPPAFSAVKVHGKRAYKLARQGKAVKLEPRKVHIYKTNLDSYEYPFVRFTTEVNSGTYIRSLVQDIGEKLGTGAYMSDLRRTKVGKYKLINAYDLAQLDQEQLFSNVITVA
jgi:tRNA pseudouridine55 synthase